MTLLSVKHIYFSPEMYYSFSSPDSHFVTQFHSNHLAVELAAEESVTRQNYSLAQI